MSHTQLHRLGDAAGWRCTYCGYRLYCHRCYPFPLPRAREITRDHVVPRSRGGKGGDNLVASCFPCNKDKGNRLLHEPPTPKRDAQGCHLGGKIRRSRSGLKKYPSLELALVMAKTVESTKGVALEVWLCEHCEQYHLTLPRGDKCGIISEGQREDA